MTSKRSSVVATNFVPSQMISSVRGSSKAPAEIDGRYFFESSTTAGVDLDDRRLLDRVLQRFFERAAVAAADDEDALRLAMGQDGGMGQHLVVEELVGLRRLDDAVQHQHPAECGVLEDEEVLVIRLFVVENVGDLQPLVEVRMERFFEPLARQTLSPRRCSCSCTLSGWKTSRRTGIAL